MADRGGGKGPTIEIEEPLTKILKEGSGGTEKRSDIRSGLGEGDLVWGTTMGSFLHYVGAPKKEGYKFQ